NEECNGCNAGRNDTPRPSSGILQHGGMRREPAPAHSSGKAKLIEKFRIVVADAPGEDLPLPGAGWNFKSLQLAQDFHGPMLIAGLRTMGNMLPAEQPAHEYCRSNRLNLLAQ